MADATAESINKVNSAIKAGGEGYFRYRQIEMLPWIAPIIKEGLADSKLVTFASGEDASKGGAAGTTAASIAQVIQTVLAAQVLTKSDKDSE